MTTDHILLDHGSGGKISSAMIRDIMLPAFDNPILSMLNDGASLEVGGARLAFSTDTYTVSPLFFPGGSIGDLAINGTVNDVAMCGARPLYLSVGLIIEEGFPIEDLRRILDDMGKAARLADVLIVTGDTKVVPRGAADKIFINTSGIGLIPDGVNVGGERACVGDHIILSGTIADHGMTILTQREGLSFDTEIRSDSAPLNHMVQAILSAGKNVHVLRDPTRGGVGTTLNEIAIQSNLGIRIYEDRIPVKKDVAGICELLGFDPLYVANEGKLLVFVPPSDADAVLAAIQNDPAGKDACVIGMVTETAPKRVIMETRIGGERIVDMQTGEQLPRIC
ncbi:MAG: hydrogenase expression/formation protein HypE [Desulfobacteraceae bacterium]|nr:MAG: hydrogenase expression/formation protein HypE [Desulfobacteraceae bacterium]